MLELLVSPIDVRPPDWKPPHYFERSQFSASYSNTMQLLDRELSQLNARDEALLMDMDPSQFRVNGSLRVNARSNSPGVILRFTTKAHGTLTYPCRKFDRWQDNLRAIALGLEALRKVERYGIAERGQQYAGYAALGAGIALGEASMTYDEAFEFVRMASEGILPLTPDELAEAFRLASLRMHPDVGGDVDEFRRLVRAREVLEVAQ